MTDIKRNVELLTAIALAEREEDRNRFLAELKELATAETSSVKSEDSVRVERMLTELGIPCTVKGYYFIVTGVLEVAKAGNMLGLVTKDLYPRIAREHRVTTTQVERAIRHAVDMCMDRCDDKVRTRYFGNTISYRTGKPTSSEFIFRLARLLGREEEYHEVD